MTTTITLDVSKMQHPTVKGLHLVPLNLRGNPRCGSSYGSHTSQACMPGGSGQCDGYCYDHDQADCGCSCHGNWDLPETVVEVLAWHDEMNEIVRDSEGNPWQWVSK